MILSKQIDMVNQRCERFEDFLENLFRDKCMRVFYKPKLITNVFVFPI